MMNNRNLAQKQVNSGQQALTLDLTGLQKNENLHTQEARHDNIGPLAKEQEYDLLKSDRSDH